MEAAVVLPVFFTFLFGLFEYGRMVMVANSLESACRQAARYGATEGVTTEQVEERVRQLLDSTMDVEQLAVVIKDASVFDSGGEIPTDNEKINAMPDLELVNAQTRQLFCVHAAVSYETIALIPWPFTRGKVLSGTCYMRHE